MNADQVAKIPEPGEFIKKGAYRDGGLAAALLGRFRRPRRGDCGRVRIGGSVSATVSKAGAGVEVELGKVGAEDLVKRIYKTFAKREDNRRYLKSSRLHRSDRELPAAGEDRG